MSQKTYYSLRTGDIANDVRHLVWRYGCQGAPWKYFGFHNVSLGDRPAAALLEIAQDFLVKTLRNAIKKSFDSISFKSFTQDSLS